MVSALVSAVTLCAPQIVKRGELELLGISTSTVYRLPLVSVQLGVPLLFVVPCEKATRMLWPAPIPPVVPFAVIARLVTLLAVVLAVPKFPTKVAELVTLVSAA